MTVKIVYFQARGRAEATRMALAYGGIEFEDVRMAGPELMKARAAGEVKPPFNQFPYLEVDGVTIAQSAAMLRFAGKRAGLVPSDDVLAAQVDSVVDQANDVATSVYGIMFGPGTDEEKAAKTAELKATKLPSMLAGILAYREAHADKGAFIFGAPTIADFQLAAFADGFAQRGVALLESAPALQAVVDALNADPKLAAYLAKRAEVEAAEAAATAAAAAKTA